METLLLLDNKPIPGSDAAFVERRNPVTGDVVTRAAASNVADAIAAIVSAEAAFVSWSLTGPTERRRILMKAADLLEAKIPEFVEVMAKEIGGSSLWASFNVIIAANLIREAAALATQIQGETLPTDRAGSFSMTVRQPVGVILSMAPWNGPVPLAARAIAYPLVCGNTVVFRASETSPKTHMLLVESFVEAGLPAGVLNVIVTAPHQAAEVLEAMIAHNAVRRVNFTGSTRVGRLIAESCGRHLKRCLLELGGKSPLVILDDADVEEAVKAAVFGAFLYQGQICMSTERIVVDQKIASAFIARFIEKVRELPVGDPAAGDATCVVGPMIVAASGNRLNAMIDDAVAKGAQILIGGLADDARMSPTVIDHVTPDMRIYDEETFGPITTIVRAEDYEEAIRIANDTTYGLAAALFGQNITRTLDAAMRIRAGTCHINGPTVQTEPQAPFGGVKNSGFGRFDGRAVIDEFTEIKWITIGPSKGQYPF